MEGRHQAPGSKQVERPSAAGLLSQDPGSQDPLATPSRPRGGSCSQAHSALRVATAGRVPPSHTHFHRQKPACREPGHTRVQILTRALPKVTRMPPAALAVSGSRTHSQAPTLREVHAGRRRLDTANVADPTLECGLGRAPPARTSHTGRLELGTPNAGPVAPHPLTVLTAPLTWSDPRHHHQGPLRLLVTGLEALEQEKGNMDFGSTH